MPKYSFVVRSGSGGASIQAVGEPRRLDITGMTRDERRAMAGLISDASGITAAAAARRASFGKKGAVA